MSTELKNTNFFERLRLQLEMPFKLEFCNHWIALNGAMRDFKMVPVRAWRAKTKRRRRFDWPAPR